MTNSPPSVPTLELGHAVYPSPTLAGVAAALRTTEERLQGFGLSDTPSGLALSDDGAHVLTAPVPELFAVWDRSGHPAPYGFERFEGSSWTRLVLVAHEAECWPLWLQGVPAVALPSARAVRKLGADSLEGVNGVYVVRSAHPYGKRFVDIVARHFRGLGYKGETHALPLQGTGPDVWTLHRGKEGHERQQLRSVFRRKEPVQRRALGVLASEVKAEPVEWLWPGWVPLNKVTVVDGDPGLGKSTIFEADLAARVSTGRPMPETDYKVEGGVIIVNAEDGAGDTIRPRLEAAGADLDRCLILTTIPGNGGDRLPSIPDDIGLIREAAERVQARLVVIDPVMAYFGTTINSNSDQQVRRAMGPLKELAEETGAAVVLVRHLNKGGGGKAVYRGGGSIGITGAARSVLLVAKHPEATDPNTGKDDGRRVIAVSKSNLGASPQALGYRITDRGDTSAIEWTGKEKLSADDLVSPTTASGEERSALDDAKEFLLRMLADGPVKSTELDEAAGFNGVSGATLKRAKREMRVRAERMGYGQDGGWYCSLPDTADSDGPQ